MKPIKKQKTNLTNKELNQIRTALHESNKVKHVWIIGPDFVAVELSIVEFKSQGVAVTHWRDEHNSEIGRNIALGRATLRLALYLLEYYHSYSKVMEVLSSKRTTGIEKITTAVENFKLNHQGTL